MKIVPMFLVLVFGLWPSHSFAKECVVLLHGLGRSADSMNKLEESLNAQGYIVVNVDYPSRKMAINSLAELAVGEGVARCHAKGLEAVNFVTHSLGGILVRQYYSQHSSDSVHRVVMLGPPNQGSELVDAFGSLPGYRLLTGEAGVELGTDINSVPRQLGAVSFELGVIAGTQSINLIMSSILPSPDDGKVSVASTKIEGMSDFISLPTIHSHMMKNDAVIHQVQNFLRSGRFTPIND